MTDPEALRALTEKLIPYTTVFWGLFPALPAWLLWDAATPVIGREGMALLAVVAQFILVAKLPYGTAARAARAWVAMRG